MRYTTLYPLTKDSHNTGNFMPHSCFLGPWSMDSWFQKRADSRILQDSTSISHTFWISVHNDLSWGENPFLFTKRSLFCSLCQRNCKKMTWQWPWKISHSFWNWICTHCFFLFSSASSVERQYSKQYNSKRCRSWWQRSGAERKFNWPWEIFAVHRRNNSIQWRRRQPKVWHENYKDWRRR